MKSPHWSPKERKKRSEKCKNPKGFTMKQFCKNLKTKSKEGERKNNLSPLRLNSSKESCIYHMKSPKKKEYLFNKNNPKKSFDVYIDKNPEDTIPVKYKTITDTKNTIRKLERLYKNGEYPHKRIKQVAAIVMVRLRFMEGKEEQYKLMERYHDFLKKRTKVRGEKERKKMVFKI